MAHSHVMTAGEELPVFHDFLGIVAQRSNSTESKSGNFSYNRNVDPPTGHEAGSRSLPTKNVVGTTVETSSSPSPINLSERFYTTSRLASKNGHHKPIVDCRRGKRRDSDGAGRDTFQQLQRQPETLLSSPFVKVSRLERHGDMKGRHVDAAHVTPVQLSRMSSDCPNPVLNTSGRVKQDAMQYEWANLGNNSQNGHSSSAPDKAGLNVREGLPPSDEGSRTGLKGSSVGNLINCSQAGKADVHTNRAPALPANLAQFGRSKSFSQSATGSESLCGKSQLMTTSRQLTIFYGGQAHVFDDVTSDKVEAIMSLAGTNGRYWSTMYSPRAKASLSHTGSEGSLQAFDREGEKSATNGSNVSNFSALALSGATNGVTKAVAGLNPEQESKALALKHEEMGPSVSEPLIEVSKE